MLKILRSISIRTSSILVCKILVVLFLFIIISLGNKSKGLFSVLEISPLIYIYIGYLST